MLSTRSGFYEDDRLTGLIFFVHFVIGLPGSRFFKRYFPNPALENYQIPCPVHIYNPESRSPFSQKSRIHGRKISQFPDPEKPLLRTLTVLRKWRWFVEVYEVHSHQTQNKKLHNRSHSTSRTRRLSHFKSI